MASEQHDGGPAFPKEGPLGSGGMSLRDYFAAKAMASLCGRSGPFSAREYIPLAHRAYQMADAMLEEREK